VAGATSASASLSGVAIWTVGVTGTIATSETGKSKMGMNWRSTPTSNLSSTPNLTPAAGTHATTEAAGTDGMTVTTTATTTVTSTIVERVGRSGKSRN